MAASETPSWQAAAAANILEARKKNGRLGSRKSRAGTGRKCDGYVEQQQHLQRTSQARSAPGGNRMTLLVGLQESDKRAFDFFLACTAPRLGGSFDKDFWCGYVLQLAHAEPFVLNSLLAISTLYEHPQYLTSFTHREAIIHPVGDGLKTPAMELGQKAARPLDPHHAAALKSYNKALQEFRQQMESGKGTPLLALFSCVLFITIELIRDDIVAVLGLFSKGTELLKQFACVRFEGLEQELFTTIKLIFARLGVLAAAFGHPQAIDMPLKLEVTGKHAVFASMAEARLALYALMADSHAFIRDAAIYKASRAGDSNTGIWRAFDAVASAAESVEGKPGTGRAMPMLGISVSAADLARPMPKGNMFRPDNGNEPVITFRANMSLGVLAKATLSDKENSANLAMLARARLHDTTEGAQPENYRVYSGRSGEEGGNDAGEMSLFGGGPYKARPAPLAELYERQKHFERRLEDWHDALPSQSEPEALSSLLMFYHVASVWLTTRLASQESVFDDYTHHFQQVVHHAEIYVTAKAAPVFTFEVGAVAPLYFVATKCRVPSLRRKALEVMARAPRKECMWGATSTAQISARIIAVEEEGLGLPLPQWDGSSFDDTTPVSDSVLPAETERVQNLEILNNNNTGRYEVRVRRYREVGGQWSKVVQDYPI
ncbi:hypothetical protein LTR85_011342 [Meristemomyces frigidus]|nr:hypothetical protein LTR85_011342 [Meristemomyces frigidus]